MLTPEQVGEIKEHLNKAQNPLFFFDNDADGLCSFLLLQRFLGRGKGVPVRGSPMTKSYLRKVNELNPDYIFILDCPVIEKDFFEEIDKFNIPLIWIDHHGIDKSTIPSFVDYYNPLFNKTNNSKEDFLKEQTTAEPVTALCYQITNKKDDLWIAVVGCISDKFIPNFYSEFKKEYPDLMVETKNAFDIFYKSRIGKVARIFNFGLKDRTTNVINMLKFLVKVKSPYEVLADGSENYFMHKRFNEIDKKYKKLLERAKELEKKSGKVLFFEYSGDLSISSDLSNELSYLFPERIIVVVYDSGFKANISVRGKGVRKVILKIINDLENATGGGHEDAVGAQVKIADLEKFKRDFLSSYES